MRTNFELKSKFKALPFDEKLEKFYEGSTWHKNWNRFKGN